MRHEVIEKSVNLMMVLIVLTVSIGGLVEMLPLMVSSETTEPAENIEPYSPLRLAGRDVYIREGCYGCHSQMVRPFRSETERYGPYSIAGRIGVRPPVPVRFAAHGSRSRPRRRSLQR